MAKTEKAALERMRSDIQGWPGSQPFYRVLNAISGNGALAQHASPAVKALTHGALAALTEESSLAAVQAAASAGARAATVIAGQISGVARGVDAWLPAWRDGTDVAAVATDLAEAVGVAHRAWDMGRDIPGATWHTGNIFGERPVSMLPWPRFSGWWRAALRPPVASSR